MTPRATPWTITADGLTLTVRLTPKSARDALEGIAHLDDGEAVLKVRVRAAPREGAANAALCTLLAATLKVPIRAVTVDGGASGRRKRLRIAGDGARLAAVLEECVS